MSSLTCAPYWPRANLMLKTYDCHRICSGVEPRPAASLRWPFPERKHSHNTVQDESFADIQKEYRYHGRSHLQQLILARCVRYSRSPYCLYDHARSRSREAQQSAPQPLMWDGPSPKTALSFLQVRPCAVKWQILDNHDDSVARGTWLLTCSSHMEI